MLFLDACGIGSCSSDNAGYIFLGIIGAIALVAIICIVVHFIQKGRNKS